MTGVGENCLAQLSLFQRTELRKLVCPAVYQSKQLFPLNVTVGSLELLVWFLEDIGFVSRPGTHYSGSGCVESPQKTVVCMPVTILALVAF